MRFFGNKTFLSTLEREKNISNIKRVVNDYKKTLVLLMYVISYLAKFYRDYKKNSTRSPYYIFILILYSLYIL